MTPTNFKKSYCKNLKISPNINIFCILRSNFQIYEFFGADFRHMIFWDFNTFITTTIDAFFLEKKIKNRMLNSPIVILKKKISQLSQLLFLFYNYILHTSKF